LRDLQETTTTEEETEIEEETIAETIEDLETSLILMCEFVHNF
jgi:hypothetical protein